jgi:RNA polymerase sigma factor (sigma-70 family)
MTIEELWTEYRNDRNNIELRNKIVEHYINEGLIDGVINAYFSRMNMALIEREDLYQEGFKGLLRAIELNDRDEKQFLSLARTKIKCYILDYFRIINPNKRRGLDDPNFVWTTSYDNSSSGEKDGSDMHYLLEIKEPNVLERLSNKEYIDRLVEFDRPIHTIIAKLRLISNLNIREIGRTIGVSQSRISQILIDEILPMIKIRNEILIKEYYGHI